MITSSKFGTQQAMTNTSVLLQCYHLTSHYRMMEGAVLIFDLTRPNTFTSIKRYLKELRTYCSKRLKIIIIGNKVDEANEIGVYDDSLREAAKILCDKENSSYFETSVKNDINVNEAFSALMESC